MLRNKLIYLHSNNLTHQQIMAELKINPNLDNIDQVNADQYVEKLQCNVLTILDLKYPQKLKLMANPPWIIYYIGDLKLLEQRLVYITGEHYPSDYGMIATADYIKNINDKVIISGLTYGIDYQANLKALQNNLKTIAVVSQGLNFVYPPHAINLYQKIKEDHLVLSIYPPMQRLKKNMFAQRNEILVNLADEVCIMEAKENSYLIKIAEYAQEQVKEVYALPGSIYSVKSQGTNLLIQEGASVIYLEK